MLLLTFSALSAIESIEGYAMCIVVLCDLSIDIADIHWTSEQPNVQIVLEMLLDPPLGFSRHSSVLMHSRVTKTEKFNHCFDFRSSFQIIFSMNNDPRWRC